MDIGATVMKAALVGLHGDLLASFREASPRTPSALRDFVQSVRKRSPGPVLGVGIGCKGVIDPATTRVNRLPGDLHFMEGHTLHELVDAAELPVCADNDARTALVAEVLWGAARGRHNVVLLTLGTGVGGAAGCILRWRRSSRFGTSGISPSSTPQARPTPRAHTSTRRTTWNRAHPA